MKRSHSVALCCIFALVFSQGCLSVQSQKLAAGKKFTNVQGQPVSLVTGRDYEVRWLFIPIHRMEDTARLQTSMESKGTADGGNAFHLLNAGYSEIPIWMFPPYFLFPMPAKEIYLIGVSTKVP